MKSKGKVLLIVVAIVFGGYTSQVLASETPPANSKLQDDCLVDERIECAERCQTEHNCCIKSCNWVKPREKSKCLERCMSIAKQCYRTCDDKAAADERQESPKRDSP